jgi:hypothetical protein
MVVDTDGPVTDEAVVGGAVVAGNVVDGGGVVDVAGLIDVVVAGVDTRVDDDGGVAVSTTGPVDAMSSSPPQADMYMPVVATSRTPPRRHRSFTATPSPNRRESDHLTGAADCQAIPSRLELRQRVSSAVARSRWSAMHTASAPTSWRSRTRRRASSSC